MKIGAVARVGPILYTYCSDENILQKRRDHEVHKIFAMRICEKYAHFAL